MKKITTKKIALVSVGLALMVPSLVLAGNLEPPAAPSDAASAVYRTDDVYNRLQSGASAAKRSGAFTEPSAGPTDGVGMTMDEIMAIAPTVDNVNGASQADVKNGKTFWGLRTDGTWGPKTGSGSGSANQALVPRSGQTTCYHVSFNSPTPCGVSTPGQDGALQKGVALPSPRFTINMNGATPDGTVTDNKTGLIWLTNANCLETVGGVTKGSPGNLSWLNALTWSNNLAHGKCGLSDNSAAGAWRLPNKEELSSLVNAQYFLPPLSNTAGTAQMTSGNPFTDVVSNGYWSSTTDAYGPSSAWLVYFSLGTINNSYKTNSNYVWPVRGGQ